MENKMINLSNPPVLRVNTLIKLGLLFTLIVSSPKLSAQDCLDTAETDCEVVKCVNSLIKQKIANKEAIKANPHDLMHFYLSVDVMKRGVEYGSESVVGCEAEWNKLLANSKLALDLLVNDGDYFLARFVKAYLLENESPPNYNAALKCLMWIESKMFTFKREHFNYFEEEEEWESSDLEIILLNAKIMADYRQMNIFYKKDKNSSAYEGDTTPDLLLDNIIALDKLIYEKQKGKDYNLGLFHSTSLKHLGLYWGDILLEVPDFLAKVYFSGLLGVPTDREKAAKLAMILVKHYPSNSNALTLAYNVTNQLVEEGYAYADVLHFQVSYHMYSFFKNSLKEDYVKRLENTLYGFEVRGNKSIADYMQKYNGQGPAHKVFQDRQSLEMDIALKKKDLYRVYCEGAGIMGDPFYDGYGKPPHLR